MPGQAVKRGETARLGRIEGDLQVGRGATIKAESGGKVVVSGDVVFDGGATVDCSLECNAVEVKAAPHTGGTIEVHGDLTAHQDVDVADSLEVSRKATAEGFDVGGHLKAGSVASKRLRAGGHVRVKDTIDSESVDVAGHFSAMGTVKIVDLHVGGHAEVGGGTISGNIQVRGHFEARSSLVYGELQTFGHVSLPANSRGDRLSVFGRVEFAGDASCKVIDVKGVAEAKGDCTADEVEVSGKLRVSGSLKVSKELRVLGVADIGGRVDCQKLTAEGRLSADRAFAVEEADLSGELKTTNGLKSSTITVRKYARVAGPLVGEHIEVGEQPSFGQWPSAWSGTWTRYGQMTDVEDVYGGSVRLGPYSRSKRVFADEVLMENGSVADQVSYTGDLKLPSKYYIHQPPQKVAKLPDPPL